MKIERVHEIQKVMTFSEYQQLKDVLLNYMVESFSSNVEDEKENLDFDIFEEVALAHTVLGDKTELSTDVVLMPSQLKIVQMVYGSKVEHREELSFKDAKEMIEFLTWNRFEDVIYLNQLDVEELEKQEMAS